MSDSTEVVRQAGYYRHGLYRKTVYLGPVDYAAIAAVAPRRDPDDCWEIGAGYVYMLLGHNESPVYIGQSLAPRNRIPQHEGKDWFDLVRWCRIVECRREEMGAIERLEIQAQQPMKNRVLIGSSAMYPPSVIELGKKYGVNPGWWLQHSFFLHGCSHDPHAPCHRFECQAQVARDDLEYQRECERIDAMDDMEHGAWLKEHGLDG